MEFGDLAKMPADHYQELFKNRAKESGMNGNGNGRKQVIIPLSELENMISEGCEYVPNEYLEKKGKAIIKLPKAEEITSS
jgi:hypothetical protein